MILFSLGLAEDINNQETWDSIIANQHANGDTKQTEASLVKLSHFIDLWHDANLKGNKKNIFSFEQDIIAVAQFDIRTSQQFVDFKEKEQNNYEMKNAQVKDFGRNNLNKMSSILQAKKRLLGSFTRTNSFSNKLRLMGDYQELMRRELDLSRVKLAEDWEGMVDELQEEHQD